MKTNVRTQRILGMLIASAKHHIGIIQDVHPALVDDRTSTQLAQDRDYVMAQALLLNMMNGLLEKNSHRFYGQNFFSIDEIDQELALVKHGSVNESE